MCDNVVWQADVLGEQKLQSELLYARILHQCGDRTIHQTAYVDAIEAHLRRDLNEKNLECRQDDPEKGFYQVAKNLAQCAIGMDKALKKVNENLAKTHAHENAEERRQQKEDALHPFKTLEVRIDRDIFDANGKLERPKGIVLKGDKAYKQLADLVVADRREFAHYRDRGYGRKVDVTVSFKGKEYPVHLENGKLLGGNARSVADLLENCMTRKTREQAYNDSVRRRELAERTKSSSSRIRTTKNSSSSTRKRRANTTRTPNGGRSSIPLRASFLTKSGGSRKWKCVSSTKNTAGPGLKPRPA